MITGIHWPDAADKTWEVIYHLMRTGVTDPSHENGIVQPNITAAGSLKGGKVPLEIEISIALPDTRTPSVASVQDIWVGADWNEKETWDLVGIDFDGHQGMRRVLQPHETPKGFHPLQKQHRLRYHSFQDMYDDSQGFMRKPADAGKIK
jgi:NADH:ubiquinone oxidoreductase subunit C